MMVISKLAVQESGKELLRQVALSSLQSRQQGRTDRWIS